MARMQELILLELNMNSTIERVVANSTQIPCQHCPFKSDSAYNHERHRIIYHAKIEPFHCSECSFSSTWKRSLETHVKNIHPCQKAFMIKLSEQTLYQRHLELADFLEGAQIRTFGIVDVQLVPKLYLKLFAIYDDLGSRVFKCDHCPFSTESCQLLNEHNLIHDENGSFVCLECSEAVFKTKWKTEMTKHLRKEHAKRSTSTLVR